MKTKSLNQLRAKTDQELAILVAKQLHRSRQLVRAGQYIAAAKLYSEAVKLLHVAELAPADAARLEKLRAQVRQIVELPLGAIA
jgi:hypothetical protein